MRIAGIDLSTHAVDIVFVPVEGDEPPLWNRYELTGHDAWERTRKVGEVLPGRASTYWDDVLAVGIEEPAGRNPGFSFRVQGAVLSMLPASLLVEKWMPSQWRKANGIPGNASKEDVQYVVALLRLNLAAKAGGKLDGDLVWPQDACDAYCIALATRQAIHIGAAA